MNSRNSTKILNKVPECNTNEREIQRLCLHSPCLTKKGIKSMLLKNGTPKSYKKQK